MLRDVIRAQVLSRLGLPAQQQRYSPRQDAAVASRVKACLERISVSRIFDIEGLWEVIGELETPPPPPQHAPPQDERASRSPTAGAPHGGEDLRSSASSELSDPPASSQLSASEAAAGEPPVDPPTEGVRDRKGEVLDSEDEGEELSLSPSPPPPPPSPPASRPAKEKSPSPTDEVSKVKEEGKGAALKNQERNTQGDQATGELHGPSSHVPDMILITHFSSLLTTLFTRRDRAGAHSALALLSAHLRYLARTAGPLVMLLNTTSSSSSSSAPGLAAAATRPRPLDPTLRSVFSHNSGSGSGSGGGGGGHRVNKPAYGATFAGLLDAHLLCTRVPRARADAEALLSAPARCRRAWVVEVLMDEVGVWEWREEAEDGGASGKEAERRWTRRCREQRWGAVDVRERVRIVDAFVNS